MVEDIKLILNKIIFNELQLSEIEKKLSEAGIKNKNISNPKHINIPSKYFFLMNEVHFENLSDSDKNTLISLYNKSKSGNEEDKNNLYKFLEKIKLQLLLPKGKMKYIYYDVQDDEHLVPSDSIVLSFHYMRYNDNFKEDVDQQKEEYINNIINYIQYKLAPNNLLKVAIIKYDEINKNLSRKI